MMKKAPIPSLVITNLIVLKTKITYIQTKNSMEVPIVSGLFVTVSIKKIFTNDLHVVAKEDPRARTVDGRVVQDGSQL